MDNSFHLSAVITVLVIVIMTAIAAAIRGIPRNWKLPVFLEFLNKNNNDNNNKLTDSNPTTPISTTICSTDKDSSSAAPYSGGKQSKWKRKKDKQQQKKDSDQENIKDNNKITLALLIEKEEKITTEEDNGVQSVASTSPRVPAVVPSITTAIPVEDNRDCSDMFCLTKQSGSKSPSSNIPQLDMRYTYLAVIVMHPFVLLDLFLYLRMFYYWIYI